MSQATTTAALLSAAVLLLLATTRADCRAMPAHQAGGVVEGGNSVAPGSNCTKDSRAKTICDECIYVTGAREAYESCCANLNRVQEYCEHFLRYAPDSSVNDTAARERRGR